MTTTSPERISLASPAALCAAVPHLLGFTPDNSAVLVWLSGGRIVVTQRVDLPDPLAPLEEWVTHVWAHAGARMADEIILVICWEGSDPFPHEPLATAVAARARDIGQGVRDVLHLQGARWRSLLCRDSSCCPPTGHPIPESVGCAVAAEFVIEGRAPRSGRLQVLREFDPDTSLMAQVLATGILGGLRRPSAMARERWRESILTNLLVWLQNPDTPAPPARLAHLLQGLNDIRVRDTVLWELSRWGHEARHVALVQFTRLVVAAPGRHVMPPATCAAVTAWLVGDGVRASAALARAESEDASYSLATLLNSALSQGMPPREWLQMMAALPRDVCRHGRGLPDAGDSV
jgi:Domain of unknown function (DUF4192)